MSSHRDVESLLSYLHEEVPRFITSISNQLLEHHTDVASLSADHVCYRTQSLEQYAELTKSLNRAPEKCKLLIESEIGGRPISTYKLARPIAFGCGGIERKIDVIEVPSPKRGSPYKDGLEHVEFVIGDGRNNMSPLNDENHREALQNFINANQSISWSTKAMKKDCNPDVSAKLEIERYGTVSVKFHLMPLEDVINFELKQT